MENFRKNLKILEKNKKFQGKIKNSRINLKNSQNFWKTWKKMQFLGLGRG